MREFDGLVAQETSRCGHRPSPVFDRDDLLQAGRLGVVKAVETYDPARGELRVWVRGCVRNSLREALRLEADPLTRSLRAWARRIDAASGELRGELGREPSEGEVAGRLGVDERYLSTLRSHIRFSQPGGLGVDDEVGDETDTEQQALVRALRGQLWEAVGALDERDRQLVMKLFVEGKTVRQVADDLDTSRTSVQRHSARVLAVLRAALHV